MMPAKPMAAGAPQVAKAPDGRPVGHQWRHVALDLETCHAPEDVVAAAVGRLEAPGHYKDPDAIKRFLDSAAQRVRDRSALLDGAPIGCVSIRTESGAWSFAAWARTTKRDKTGWHGTTHYAGGEPAMLAELREVLDANTSGESLLIGWNLLAFDLPKLRARYVKHRLKLPAVLTPRALDDQRQPASDTMRLYLSYFSVELHGERMVSLREALDRLELPRYKDLVDGAQVPVLIAEGKTEEVLKYCELDAAATYTVFLLLTGQGNGVK